MARKLSSAESFRNTLALLGQQLCHSPEEFKAWSQNLGHEKVMTTFTSYGNVEAGRQAEIIRGLEKPGESDGNADDLIRQLSLALEARTRP